MTRPYRLRGDHLLLSVRLTPGGGRDAVDGVEQAADGGAQLRARVSAAPEKGKANKALVAMLAKRLRIAKSSISVVAGDTSRQKILRIDGDAEDLAIRMECLGA